MAVNLGSGGVRSDINVTPLVDVCLVLLIIFMVVTPMLQQGITVQLPSGETVVERPGSRDDLIVSVREDGSVFRGTTWIPREDVAAWLGEEAKGSTDRAIVLKADGRARHGDVRAVLRIAAEAGFRRVAILTEKTPAAQEAR